MWQMDRLKSAFSSQRYFGILTGAASGLLARGLTLAFGLLAVNLLLPYLGPERFGAWAVITTLQIWLQLADFGLPAGANNPLVSALSRNDARKARQLVLNPIVFIAIVGAMLFCAFSVLICIGTFESYIAFSTAAIKQEFSQAVLIGVGLTMLSIPNSVVNKALAVQHKGATANLWVSIGQVAAIGGLIVSARWQLDTVWLTSMTTGSIALSSLCCTFNFYLRNPKFRPLHGDLSLLSMSDLWRVSASYSALQISGMLLLNSAIFIVTLALSPTAAAVFAATSRLTSLCTFFAQLASPYFWVSYSHAIAQSEYHWLRVAFGRQLALSVGTTLILGLLLSAFGPTVILWWTSGSIKPDVSLLLWLLAWQLVVAVMNPISSLLSAYEKYGLQTLTSFSAGVLAVLVSYSLAPKYGAASVVAATTLAYVLIVFVPVSIQARKVLRLS